MFNKIGTEIIEQVLKYSDNELPGKVSVKIPQNISNTYNLLIKGHSLREIASLRKLDEAVISMQIETILQYLPDTDISHLFNPAEFEKINSEIDKGYDNLKELKSRLQSSISFSLLRIAAAKRKYSKAPRA
jgi:hypothetical protein